MIERYVATDSAGFGPHLDLFVALAEAAEINGRPAIEDGRIRQQIARNYAMRNSLDAITARAMTMMQAGIDRKSVVEGKGGSVRVDLGGRRIIKKKKKNEK